MSVGKADMVSLVLVRASDRWRTVEELHGLVAMDSHVRAEGGAGVSLVKKCVLSLLELGAMEKRWRGGKPGAVGVRAMEYRAK